MDNPKFGVINEIGDLGLGFQELNEQDQKTLEADKSLRETKEEKQKH